MSNEIALEEMQPCCSADGHDATDSRIQPLSTKEQTQLTAAVLALSRSTPRRNAEQTHDDDDDDHDDDDEDTAITAAKSKLKQHLHVLLEQVRSRHTWTVVMVTLGTFYMLTNLWNAQQMWNPNLQYELVVGPPMFIMKILIAVFTFIGTVMWLLELVSHASSVPSCGCPSW